MRIERLRAEHSRLAVAGRRGVVGAQPSEALEQLVRQAAPGNTEA